MKVYKSEEVRNVVIAAHQGSGKTSLVEAMMYTAGVTNRLGRVTEGNTISDYRPEEVKKNISVNTSLLACEWKGKKLNLLDVPGFTDFLGELECAIPVAETVLMLVDSPSGVGVTTEMVYDMACENNKSCVILINKLDRENADYEKNLAELKDKFEKIIVPAQIPIGAESEFHGIIDVLNQTAFTYDKDGKGKEIPIPEDQKEQAEEYYQALMEAAAEGDDDLIMKYLDGEELSKEEIKAGLQSAIASGTVIPVLCGSAFLNIGIDLVMDFLAEFTPSPLDILPAKDAQKPFAGLVFKTITDSFLGKLSYVKVLQGNLKNDMPLYNSNLEKEEKIGALSTSQGKTQLPIPEVSFGDIGVIAKLAATGTNQTLTVKDNAAQILEPIRFSVPTYTVAIAPQSKNDEDKLGNAINKTLEEDPTLLCVKDTETHQTLLTGMGETHIDIALDRLERKFGVLVDVIERRLPYREAIKGKATHVEGKHKKQSGGHGQFGHVFIDIEPCDEEFVFEEKIFGGSVPKQYIPAVEKGLRESMQEGILAGYPVSNIKVTLTDGSYHAVDSSEMAFKIATNLAFKKACEQAKPILLEPIMNVEIQVPDQYTGDIMGDMNSRRGRIMGMEKEGKIQVIKAMVPLAEMLRYTIDLKSMTQGRGRFSMEFSGYEEAPANVTEKVIEESKIEHNK